MNCQFCGAEERGGICQNHACEPYDEHDNTKPEYQEKKEELRRQHNRKIECKAEKTLTTLDMFGGKKLKKSGASRCRSCDCGVVRRE